jgi:hypothetical protein
MYHVGRASVAVGIPLIAIALAFAGLARATGPSTPSITDEDLAVFGVYEVVDVTSATPPVKATLTKSVAVANAREELGVTDSNVRVLFGLVQESVDGRRKPAWIVVFAGGVLPFDGPPGTDTTLLSATRVTGVIVDDATGTVLGGFIR